MTALLAGLDIGGSKVLAVAVDVSAPGGRARVVESVRLSTGLGPEGVVDTAVRALRALAGRLAEKATRSNGHSGIPADGHLAETPPANGVPATQSLVNGVPATQSLVDGTPVDESVAGSAVTGPQAWPADWFSGVGIGIPGLVDAERGRITHAVNLGVGTGGLDLADRLGARLDLPVVVENDVNAAALGAAEHLRLGHVDMAYLSIGTGIAAGIVLDGELRRGPHGAAGEIGHVPLDPSGPLCGCGQHGCLESMASGSAIASRWTSRPGSELPAGQDLFAAAAAGDPAAQSLRDEVADYLAAGTRMLALTVDVDLVVLGGGVAEVGEPLRQAVAGALDRQAAGSEFLRGLALSSRLSVVPGEEPVAAIGAALLARAPVRTETALTA
ncbi:ROK family protein [Kineosporia succinea]|uniref:NBD/HSP70 family sugar kinase n=1 Tax=Kineosporia succinea TaxID=84632 RepID=A0ABT9P7I3_9ACTN|nr:ROK family protein [Kineosporia succinea]MDP9828120.1 putative NBD/HSP70 family sugar kinase [Kineosporia succinea]